MKRTTLVASLAAASIAAATVLTVAHVQAQPAPQPQAPAVGAKAVGRLLPDLKITDTSSAKHTRDSLRGGPVVLLFISTQDAACQRTVERVLARLAQVGNAKAIALVLDPETANAATTVIARGYKTDTIGTGGARDRFIVAVADSGTRGEIGRLISADKGIVADAPTLVVANAEGTITDVWVGEPSADAVAGMWK